MNHFILFCDRTKTYLLNPLQQKVERGLALESLDTRYWRENLPI